MKGPQLKMMLPLLSIFLGLCGCGQEENLLSQEVLFEIILEDRLDDLQNYVEMAPESKNDISSIEFFDPIQGGAMPVFHAAAKYDAVSIIEWLIAEGANTDLPDSTGRVPGEIAARYESEKSLRLLKRKPLEFNDRTIFEFLSTDPLFQNRSPIRKVNGSLFSDATENFRDLQWEKTDSGVSILGHITISRSIAGSFRGVITDHSGYWRYDQESQSIR